MFYMINRGLLLGVKVDHPIDFIEKIKSIYLYEGGSAFLTETPFIIGIIMTVIGLFVMF